MQQNKKKEDAGNVRVVCRVRPLNSSEQNREYFDCLKFSNGQSIECINPNKDNQRFRLDRIFEMETRQMDIFNYAARPVIDSVLEGFNGTIFAYGQTSSGKTFTMQGPSIYDTEMKGIIPRMVDSVFDHICSSPEHVEFRLRVSIVEIYQEKIRDLLDVSKVDLKIREKKDKGIYIEDVTEKYVSEDNEVYNLMAIGNQNRTIGATNMNAGSSRSHLVFILTINMTNINDYSAKTGKLSLIDLAGSEKISKTGATGQTLEEGKKINLSLTTLGNVINALTDGKGGFVPYRNSKLTRVLQESLGGNSKTTLIVTASPSPFNIEETISTLRFGQRAKNIQNKPKINRELTVGELQNMLKKAEDKIGQQQFRIDQLESFVKTKGMELPDDNYDEAIQEQDQQVEQQIEVNIEKIQQLEEDLERERDSVKLQTEKLNNIKIEFDVINARLLQQQNENQELSNKVYKLENSQILLEQELKDTEENIQDKYQEQIKGLQTQIEELNINIQTKDKQKEKEKEKEKRENHSQTNNLKEIGEQFLMGLDLLNVEDQELTLTEKQAIETEIKREFYDDYIDQNLFDKIYQTLKGFKLVMSTGYQQDDEKEEIQNKYNQIELKRRDDKVKQLENDVKKLRDNNAYLNKTMNNGEKSLIVKMKSLEHNVEQLTIMYTQLMKNRSELKNHVYNQEKKIKRKQEMISKFQAALQEEKNFSYQYRSKYETLKTMVCQNEFGVNLMQSGVNNHSINNGKAIEMEEENMENNPIDITHTQEGVQSKKIVKCIRGGQNRNQNKNAHFKFMQSKMDQEN